MNSNSMSGEAPGHSLQHYIQADNRPPPRSFARPLDFFLLLITSKLSSKLSSNMCSNKENFNSEILTTKKRLEWKLVTTSAAKEYFVHEEV